jgi:heterotetrameric sarcosine oxidase gamma subunit
MSARMRLAPESALGKPFGVASTITRLGLDTTLTERAELGCILLTAATDPAELLHTASTSLGVPLPLRTGPISISYGRRALWISPQAWLILYEASDEESLMQAIQSTFPDRRLHAALFTDYLCWLDLSGTQSLSFLQESSFVSFDPDGLKLHHAKRTLIAGIPAFIIREQKCGYLLGVERSRAHYFVGRLISKSSRATVDQEAWPDVAGFESEARS